MSAVVMRATRRVAQLSLEKFPTTISEVPPIMIDPVAIAEPIKYSRCDDRMSIPCFSPASGGPLQEYSWVDIDRWKDVDDRRDRSQEKCAVCGGVGGQGVNRNWCRCPGVNWPEHHGELWRHTGSNHIRVRLCPECRPMRMGNVDDFPEKFRGTTMYYPGQQEVLNEWRRARKGLWLWGVTDAGKSWLGHHLAYHAAVDGFRAHFRKELDFYNDRLEDRDAALPRFKYGDVFVLDEVGKTLPTDTRIDDICSLLDAIDLGGGILICTSEFPDVESRLAGMKDKDKRPCPWPANVIRRYKQHCSMVRQLGRKASA